MQAWWLTPDSEIHGPYPNRQDLWAAVERTPTMFGLTTDDVKFGLQSANTNKLLATLDKMTLAGVIYVDWDGPSPVVKFADESHLVYLKLIKWILKENIPHDTSLILQEYTRSNGVAGRAWRQSAHAVLKGFQYSKNPDRYGTCPRCGEAISFDEIVHRRICPKCAEALV